jgi:hypothetical protein
MIDPHKILDAALRDEGSERLHQLAALAGPSLRQTLYAAGARMLNALAGEEAHHDRIRDLARRIDPGAYAVLVADTRVRPEIREGGALWLLDHGLMTEDGELTADGRQVAAVAQMNHKLLAQVRDRALSDEDFCHE